MKLDNSLFEDYENRQLLKYGVDDDKLNWVDYDKLGDSDVAGVLKANMYVDGRLRQIYTAQENHVGVIAATRLGKTTSYVIPTILSNARRKLKPDSDTHLRAHEP